MSRVTWDEMKRARDGHLSPTRFDPSRHPGLWPAVVEVGRDEAGAMVAMRSAFDRSGCLVEFGKSFEAVRWERTPLWHVVYGDTRP